MLFFFIYLTNWNLTLTMIMTCWSAWLSTKFYLGKINATLMIKKLKLFWVLWVSMTMFANLVCFIHWTFLYNPQIHSIDLANILKHLTNCFLLNIDWFIVKIPIKIEIYAYSLVYGFSFFIFSWMYPFFGGLNE
jgi:hypothetical protein